MGQKPAITDDLCATVVKSLKDHIIHWEYPPGYRLLENDLCDEYGVSRSPAREALRTLAAGGFLEKHARRGYRVKQLNIQRAQELYDVRLALELYVVDRLTDLDLEEDSLDRLIASWDREKIGSFTTPEDIAAKDRGFHETLAEWMGNGTLLEQLRTINERIHVFRLIEFAQADVIETTSAQHRHILEALRRRDREGARRAVKENIESARQNVANTIKEALARSYDTQM